MEAIPVNSISDIEHMMKNKKGLRKVHGIMLAVGLVMTAIQIGTIAYWIVRGTWLPFVIGMPIVIFLGIIITRMYYKSTAYICAECTTTFQPTFWALNFSAHTPKTRKLTCPKCRHKGYCVEAYVKGQ
jgi:DNA-directed RNA polymerase subunit RPC12/RpoP